MSAHSLFSPSSLGYLKACPCWRSGPSGKWSLRGIELHQGVHSEILSIIDSYPGRDWTKEHVIPTSIEGVWGTADWVGLQDGNPTVLIELKTGFGIHSGAELQVKAYSLGLLEKYGQDVHWYIVELDKHQVLKGVYSLSDIGELENEIRDIISYVKNSDWSERSFSEGCKYCIHSVRCGLDITEVDLVIAGEDLTHLNNMLSLIETAIEKVRVKVVDGIKGGEEMTGWKLTQSKAPRTWRDDDEARKFLSEKGIGLKLPSVSDVVKAGVEIPNALLSDVVHRDVLRKVK